MEQFSGAVSLPQIKGEHAQFTDKIHDFQKYLVACLAKGTTWGPWKVAVEDEKTESFDAEKLRGLISALILEGSFVKHVGSLLYDMVSETFRSTILIATLLCSYRTRSPISTLYDCAEQE